MSSAHHQLRMGHTLVPVFDETPHASQDGWQDGYLGAHKEKTITAAILATSEHKRRGVPRHETSAKPRHMSCSALYPGHHSMRSTLHIQHTNITDFMAVLTLLTRR